MTINDFNTDANVSLGKKAEADIRKSGWSAVAEFLPLGTWTHLFPFSGSQAQCDLPHPKGTQEQAQGLICWADLAFIPSCALMLCLSNSNVQASQLGKCWFRVSGVELECLHFSQTPDNADETPSVGSLSDFLFSIKHYLFFSLEKGRYSMTDEHNSFDPMTFQSNGRDGHFGDSLHTVWAEFYQRQNQSAWEHWGYD